MPVAVFAGCSGCSVSATRQASRPRRRDGRCVRDRNAEHLIQWYAVQQAPGGTYGSGVRHDHNRTIAIRRGGESVVQPVAHTTHQILNSFAVGRRRTHPVRHPLRESMRVRAFQRAPFLSIPIAKIQLAKTRVGGEWQVQRLCNDCGGCRRAIQIATDNGIHREVAQRERTHRRLTGGREWYIKLPNTTTVDVLRLTMSNKNESRPRCHAESNGVNRQARTR